MTQRGARSPARSVAYAVVAVVHLLAAVAVWRDLAGRSAAEVRGNPTLWRIAAALNTGNALLYFLVGRRR